MKTELWAVPVCPGCFEDMPLRWLRNGWYRVAKTWLSDKEMTFDNAQTWAKEQGGRCPTKEEIHLMIGCGLLKEGSNSFWSSSVYSNNRSYAWYFYGYNGYVTFSSRVSTTPVRCVGRP